MNTQESIDFFFKLDKLMLQLLINLDLLDFPANKLIEKRRKNTY